MAYLHSTRPQGKTESFLSILHVLATTYPSFKPFVDTFKSPTLDPPYWQSDGMPWWGLGLTDEGLYGMVLLSGACTLAHIVLKVHWSSYPISIPHSHYPIPLTRQLVINTLVLSKMITFCIKEQAVMNVNVCSYHAHSSCNSLVKLWQYIICICLSYQSCS
jgi:hypothetical protein